MAGGLVGDVIERHSNSSLPQLPRSSGGSNGVSKAGFPTVHHRSKATSAFKRARQDDLKQSGPSESGERLADTIVPKSHLVDTDMGLDISRPEDWMTEISRTNEEVVARMGADEKARERQDILDRFGIGIEDLMAKVREARERRGVPRAQPDVSYVHPNSKATSVPESTSPPLPARAVRKIRFMEPTEADVHVYESQPSSPKRTLALLPPPEDIRDRGEVSSLGNFKSIFKAADPSMAQSTSSHGQIGVDLPEEGTPEDIRRRFFPFEPPPEANPALAWMLSSPSSPISDHHMSSMQGSNLGTSQVPRYSLSGVQLSPAQISNLPAHLGLHHHAASSPSETLAGYTLSDLLLLSRSSVPAQRASILGVLAKLLGVAREQKYKLECGRSAPSSAETKEGSHIVDEPDHSIDLNVLRRDLLDTAIDALGEKGGVGQRGLELLWEVIVGFTRSDYGVVDLKDLNCVDLTPKNSSTWSSTPLVSATSVTEPSTFNTSHQAPDINIFIPVANILPKLRQHLIASPSPISRVHTQVLEILLVLSHFSAHARTIVHPQTDQGIISVILEPHLRYSFDSEDDKLEDNCATPTSIHILQALARSSKDSAMKLIGPADVLLRYITTPHSILTSTRQHSSEQFSYLFMTLLEETLRFYTILSQYGLYSQFATITQEHFSRIGEFISNALRISSAPPLVSLSRAYVTLLGTLIVCATDPHQTTPSHDILWSQILGWGWAEWTIELAELLGSTSTTLSPQYSPGDMATQGLWADVFRTLAAWLEGVSVNGVKGGETEKASTMARLRPLLEPRCGAWYVISRAVATLQTWEIPSSLDLSRAHALATAADLVAVMMKLAVACFVPGATDKQFHFPLEEIKTFCVRIADKTCSGGPFTLVFDTDTKLPESIHVFVRPLSTLLVSQLKFWHQSILPLDATGAEPAIQVEEWTTQALRVLGVLLPGDEGHAQWIIDTVCETISLEFAREVLPRKEFPPELWGKYGIKILLPFLSCSLQPVLPIGGDEINHYRPTHIAPTWPTPRSISQSTTLNLPSVSHLRDAWRSYDPDVVLPLRNYWPMSPLNHLLRSGTSLVFRMLPSSWDASETEVVRASLLLACVAQELANKNSLKVGNPWRTSCNEAIFACMKVFMLEHGQRQLDSGDEVFRDSAVTEWMEDLLKPFTYSYSRDNHLQQNSPSLELVSKEFLRVGTTFYQFYTDFLALYDAISFSHTLFAKLLLPPVSMAYPKDYRQLLFGDFGHVLHTVKTDVLDVLCEDVRDYLWPIERDAQIIGWYLKSLTSNTSGFVRWVAVHHVAANIWPEFTSGQPSRERAGKLLNALLQQGNNEIVREVALYRQRVDEVLAPPSCFVPGENAWRVARLEWIENICDERAKTILQKLLLD